VTFGRRNTVAFNLLESVTDLTSNGFPAAAARFLGETPAATRAAIGYVAPVVVAGIARQGLTTEGASDVMESLSSAPGPDDLPDANTILSGGSRTTGLIAQGTTLARRWFGDRVQWAAGSVGSLASIKSESALTLFYLTVPLALACLKEHVASGGQDVAELQQTLESQFAWVQARMDPRVAAAAKLRHAGLTREVPPRRPAAIRPVRPDRREGETGRFITLSAFVLAALLLFAFLRGRASTSSSHPAPTPVLVANTAARAEPHAREKASTKSVSAGEIAPSATGLPLIVHFDVSSSALSAADEQSVTTLADKLTHDGTHIDITGYTDQTGSRSANITLARHRAVTVHDALVVAGVPTDQITMRPPADATGSGAPEDARRVEITQAR
jgi:outer membrane protein OmpA-like peptidoglycan-associated protein